MNLDFIDAECDVSVSHEMPLISEFSDEVDKSTDEVKKRTRGRSATRA